MLDSAFHPSRAHVPARSCAFCQSTVVSDHGRSPSCFAAALAMIRRTFRSSRTSSAAASSRDRSPDSFTEKSRCSSEFYADDEAMDTSRPLSCPKPPTLADILNNTAPAPWTQSAFTAFLSQNHCLETFEFILDAERYRKHYDLIAALGNTNPDGTEYIKTLWKRLLDAYIAPNGQRELNLPSEVRDAVLQQRDALEAPHPSQLEPAIKIIHELMEDSLLLPFINAHKAVYAVESPVLADKLDFLDDSHSRRSKHTRNKHSNPRNLSPHSTIPIQYRHSSSPHHEYDSGDASSGPKEPMTPPDSPPVGDAFRAVLSRSAPGHGGAWSKMTGRFGFKKRHGHSEDPAMIPRSINTADWSTPGIEDEGGLLGLSPHDANSPGPPL